MVKLRVAPLVLALGLLLAGCGSGDDGTASNGPATTEVDGPEGAKVDLKDLKFIPEKVSIEKGEKVVWIWKENVLHNVAGDGFKSDNLSDGKYEHTFAKAGTYDYQCTLHAGMTGTVTVS